MRKIDIYDEFISWLEEHNGKLPTQYSNDKKEVTLYRRWSNSELKRVLEEYAEQDISKVPKEYRERIEKLREYKLGLEKKNKEHIVYRILKWLEEHEGKFPKNKSQFDKENMTSEQRKEANLNTYWYRSKEREIVEKYIDKNMEDIPKEYRKMLEKFKYYKDLREKAKAEEKAIKDKQREEKKALLESQKEEERLKKAKEKEMIRIKKQEIKEREKEERKRIRFENRLKLRQQKIVSKKNIGEDIFDWLDEHNGRLPRIGIYKKSDEKYTDQEKDEKKLYLRWYFSIERDVVNKYAGDDVQNIPEEHREIVQRFRSYGIGLEKVEKKLLLDERMLKWLESHDGKLPNKKGDKEEKTLYETWMHSKIKKTIYSYIEMNIEDVPEEDKELVQKFRDYGVGIKVKKEEKIIRPKITLPEKVLNWLENHDGKIMKANFKGRFKNEDLTPEEIKEKNLYFNWNRSKEKRIINEYAGENIENVPEEYREMVQKFRNYGIGIKNKDADIIKTMRSCVLNHVDTNIQTRNELNKEKEHISH